MPRQKKSNTNFVAEQPRRGWAYFPESDIWRRAPEPWGAPRGHCPREYGDWVAVSKPKGWSPPSGTIAGESLLGAGGASLELFTATGGDAGAGGGHMKIGAGHKPQLYDAHGRYTGPGGGSVSMRDGQVRLYADEADENPGGEEPAEEDTGGEQEEAAEEVYQELEGVLVADSGRVASDAEGGTPGTDNEAWRLREKQYTPEKLAENARADVGSDKWYPRQVNGETKNQCNIFVADKLHETGAPVPNVGGTAGTLGAETSDWLNAKTDGRIGGQPPSASDWHKGNVPGYEEVKIKDGEMPKPGDITSDGKHVGVVSGEGKTVSVTTVYGSPKYGQVVENDWGFRDHQKGEVVFRRYSGPARNMQ